MSRSKIYNFQDKYTSFSDMMRLLLLKSQASKTCKSKILSCQRHKCASKFKLSKGEIWQTHFDESTGFSLVTINSKTKKKSRNQEVM